MFEVMQSSLGDGARPTFLAQLMSGYRDPADDEGKPYTYEDYHKIALYIHAAFESPHAIFAELQAGYDAIDSNDVDEKIIYLSNATFFIREMILVDQKQEYFFFLQTEIIQPFLTNIKKDADDRLKSIFIKFESLLDIAIEHVTQTKKESDALIEIKKGRPFGKVNINDFLYNVRHAKKTAKVVAHDLKEMNSTLISQINVSDFYYNKIGKKTPSSAMLTITENSNKLSHIVMKDILFAGTEERQKGIFQFYVNVIEHSLNIHNYESASAIFNGLHHQSISRLDLSDNQPSKIQKLFNKHAKLFSPSDNFKELRLTLRASEEKGYFLIPILSIYKKDLTFANDKTEDVFHGKINGLKLAMLGAILDNFVSHQNKTLSSEPKALKTNYIEKFYSHTPPEDELFEKSYELKPFSSNSQFSTRKKEKSRQSFLLSRSIPEKKRKEKGKGKEKRKGKEKAEEENQDRSTQSLHLDLDLDLDLATQLDECHIVPISKGSQTERERERQSRPTSSFPFIALTFRRKTSSSSSSSSNIASSNIDLDPINGELTMDEHNEQDEHNPSPLQLT